MLMMLFLLFSLNGSLSLFSSNEIDTKDAVAIHDKNIVYNKYLATEKIKEKAETAYLEWDSIPILSPIMVRNINYISSDYGHRIHPVYLRPMMHHGIDFSARLGTTVYSTAKGIVTKVKILRQGYGHEIIIAHSNGYSTRYAHLDEIFVEEGQHVNAYTYIGTVGNTGLSTGPHLHYEILWHNRPIDPMYFTYGNGNKRTQDNYFNSLIALEKNTTLGMYQYATNIQVISSTKIN